MTVIILQGSFSTQVYRVLKTCQKNLWISNCERSEQTKNLESLSIFGQPATYFFANIFSPNSFLLKQKILVPIYHDIICHSPAWRSHEIYAYALHFHFVC